jgi:hypothetical protein
MAKDYPTALPAHDYTKAENIAIISDTAKRYGIPDFIPLNIAELESSYDEKAAGDKRNGIATSHGLFQLHWGGLAPEGSTKEQLWNPKYNADIAVKNMMPSYNLGVKLGLDNYNLLAFVANRSGWPGRLGVEWTKEKRPDYVKRLKEVYANDGKSAIINDGSRPEQLPAMPDIYGPYDPTIGTLEDSPAGVFKAISEHEQIQSYKEWKEEQTGLGGLVGGMNPFNYFMDQGTPLAVRSMVILIGLLFIILAVVKISMSMPAGQGAASMLGAAEGGAE